MKYEEYKKTLYAITKGKRYSECITKSGNDITVIENGLGYIVALASVIYPIGTNKDGDFILTDLLSFETLEEAKSQKEKWALIE